MGIPIWSIRRAGRWVPVWAPPSTVPTGGGPSPVTPPTAAFTATANGTSVSFNASASQPGDAAIASYAWKFGDGAAGTGKTSSHSYSAAGPFQVTLTVTATDGSTGATTHSVTPSMTGDTGGTGVQQSGSGITPMQSLPSSTFSNQVNAAGSSALVALEAKTYSFNDFAISGSGGSTALSSFWFGANLTARGILGAGSNYTTIEMVPNTSTKAGTIPSTNGQSNNLDYVNISTANAKVDGVKILGTSQGHLYNGLRFTGNASATFSNSSVVAIPGNSGSPPGETFGVNFQACTGTVTVTNITADGQNVGAAAMGSNHATARFTVTNYLAINNKYSAGWASWHQLGQMDFHGFIMKNGARAFNAEGLGAEVNFYDPLWDDPFSGHSDVNPTYESGFAGGHLNFYFTDQAAWNAFIATRTNKKITAVSNSSSVSLGLVKSDVVRVYIGGVLQTQSNYVQWTGI